MTPIEKTMIHAAERFLAHHSTAAAAVLPLADGKVVAVGDKAEVLAMLGTISRSKSTLQDRPLYWAAINCPHMIDADAVNLYCDPTLPGNALSQLGARLDAAAEAMKGEPTVAPSIGNDPGFVQMLMDSRGDYFSERDFPKMIAYIDKFHAEGGKAY